MKYFLFLLFFLCSFANAGMSVGSRSSSVSVSRPAVSSFRPSTPTTPSKVVQNVTVNKTTIVRQSSPTVVQQSGGGGTGFLGTVVASGIGSAIANWMFQPKPQPTQTIDCTLQQNQQLAICQPKPNP